MKAIQVQKTGGPEVLTLVDLPIPKPRANEAVVKLMHGKGEEVKA